MLQPEKKFFSLEEYFEIENRAEFKSEYYHGELFAMAGASIAHNLIVSNLITALNNSLSDSDCFVFPSDVKVQVDPALHYTYPDVSVVCNEIEYFENKNDTIVNPVVIFEVLSQSTIDYDRGTKFKEYRKIKSLKDYILVDQYNIFVEHFLKNESGFWSLREFDRITDSFNIRSIDVHMFLLKIYNKLIPNMLKI